MKRDIAALQAFFFPPLFFIIPIRYGNDGNSQLKKPRHKEESKKEGIEMFEGGEKTA